MIRTPYYDLAEKIGNSMYIDSMEYFVCNNLLNRHDFEAWYREDALNSELFNTGRYAWMSADGHTHRQNNNHRIIALLLLHEMEVNP